MTLDLTTLLAEERAAIDTALGRLLPGPATWPQRLHEAMRYAVLAGGKRVRPVLARLAYRAAGGDPEQILEAAAGLELIHTYSLVHDDLPALDDDVLRRGRATVHVAFDEATAVLVGDALLTEGLLVLARYPEGAQWRGRRAEATALVALAVSSRGMVGGQMADMQATGQIPDTAAPAEQQRLLEQIHHHKTGCLLQASVELGAVLAGVEGQHRQTFARFGGGLGLAFQIADDVLDATATAAELGKSPGKDQAAGKLTYVSLHGLDQARAELQRLETELAALAQELEGADGALAALARYVIRRRH